MVSEKLMSDNEVKQMRASSEKYVGQAVPDLLAVIHNFLIINNPHNSHIDIMSK